MRWTIEHAVVVASSIAQALNHRREVRDMAAYLMADVLPDDMDAYRESGYLEAAMSTAASHGAVYRVRGGDTFVLEGDWKPNRMVIIEFPSMDALMTWYESAEYQEWAKVRQRLAPKSKLVAVEGLA